MDLKEIRWRVEVDWINLAQDRVMVGCSDHSKQPQIFMKCGEFLE
jgi:hypothetical protein